MKMSMDDLTNLVFETALELVATSHNGGSL
jgi:hypothetical protein